jgi:rubredoxin
MEVLYTDENGLPPRCPLGICEDGVPPGLEWQGKPGVWWCRECGLPLIAWVRREPHAGKEDER